MSRKKLHELNEERLVRVSYTKPVAKQKQKEKSKRFLRVDPEQIFAISDKLSKSAYRVAILMIHDMNPFTNIYTGTQEDIQETLDLSEKSVRESMAELRIVDLIRNRKNGCYMVNPAIVIACAEEFMPKLLDAYAALQPRRAKKKLGGSKDED